MRYLRFELLNLLTVLAGVAAVPLVIIGVGLSMEASRHPPAITQPSTDQQVDNELRIATADFSAAKNRLDVARKDETVAYNNHDPDNVVQSWRDERDALSDMIGATDKIVALLKIHKN